MTFIKSFLFYVLSVLNPMDADVQAHATGSVSLYSLQAPEQGENTAGKCDKGIGVMGSTTCISNGF